MQGITGVTGAAPVMHEVFEHLHKYRGTSWFARPEGILDVQIHPLTGRAGKADRAGLIHEKCMWPVETERDSDFDSSGRVLLPTEYAQWFASPQNNLGTLAALATNDHGLKIVSPKPGSTYFLDPDLPASSQRLQLRAEGSEIEWTCPTLTVDTDGLRRLARLATGRHVITAHDRETGAVAETWIEVKPL
jgi:penicillin-binding protein 1C